MADESGERSKALYELRKQLKVLKGIRGSGTELISLYMAPGSQIADASNNLKNESGQASNIKSKSTRTNVQAALEKIIGYLKGFRKPPENGMAIFCGNVSKDPGRPDIQLFSIFPPNPLPTQFYRCDSQFVLEPLDDMIRVKDTYGLVVLDGKEATIAKLRGKSTEIVVRLESTAHSKHRKGGQSQRRYERQTEEAIEGYYKRIGEHIDAVFVGMKDFRGLVVGGPGPAKEDFLKLKPFNYQIKVLGMLDTGYTEDYGIQELMNKAGEIIAEQETIKEKKLMEKFIREVSRNGLVAYGDEPVRKALIGGQVEQLLISEGLETRRVHYVCSNCKQEEDKFENSSAEWSHSCGGKMKPASEIEIGEELLQIAETKGVALEMVSNDTPEGQQFLQAFHGIGAFLRYR